MILALLYPIQSVFLSFYLDASLLCDEYDGDGDENESDGESVTFNI